MYRVFPRAHSTQPSSGPKVSMGMRDSSGKRPSSRIDSFNALKTNSFSGIDGEGGLIAILEPKRSDGCICLAQPNIHSYIHPVNGPSNHSQSAGMSRKRLHFQ